MSLYSPGVKSVEVNRKIPISFFTSVFLVEDVKEIPSPDPFPSRDKSVELTQTGISTDEVGEEIDKLNTSKLPGPDGIYPRVLKELR